MFNVKLKVIIEVFCYNNLNIGIVFDGSNPYSLPSTNDFKSEDTVDTAKELISKYLDVNKDWIAPQLLDVDKIKNEFYITYGFRVPQDIRIKSGSVLWISDLSKNKNILLLEKDLINRVASHFK